MKLPIIVDENGDIDEFYSIEDAENYLEPIDVENNEYKITDAEGKKISAKVVVEKNIYLFGIFKSQIKKVKISD